MTTIPAPTLQTQREEWPDSDFDLPEGQALTAPSDAESDREEEADEDWDAEMNLGQTGGARMVLPAPVFVHQRRASSLATSSVKSSTETEEDDDDEGVSTIKLSTTPLVHPPRTPSPNMIDDDMESAFALPSDLVHLSLRPLSTHLVPRNALEWGDKDHTGSSTSSSEAYSNLGLTASPSSNGTSTSQPETETEEDDDDGFLDGLVVPTGLFDTGKGGKELTRLLEMKRKLPTVDERVRVVSPDEEDDFEIGLVIDDDVDLSPSRLMQHTVKATTFASRSKTLPPRNSQPVRPPSRLRGEGTLLQPRVPAAAQPAVRLRQSMVSPTLRPRPPSRTQTPTATSATSRGSLDGPPSTLMSTQSQTSAGLRTQKSHGVLSHTSGPVRQKLARKASLSTLLDSHTETDTTTNRPTIPKSATSATLSAASRLAGSTAASRTRTQAQLQSSRPPTAEHKVPPTRPSTPSSNPAALRLTMPTASSRLKSRPPIMSVFSPAPSSSSPPPNPRSSPVTRPRSSAEQAALPASSHPAAKLLRRPKRPRQYGDGTELDGIEDLPTDREKERMYRVTPKAPPGRPAPPTSVNKSPNSKATIGRRASRLEGFVIETGKLGPPITLRKLPRLPDSPSHRKRRTSQTNATKRKPTLIRNLGSASAPKVVGDMKWNPQTLRWEGNEQVLRDFDAAIGTSTRPALITHLTGSSIGSPVSSFASGMRIVGNMIFDPARMCWISRLPPEEDEPDPFANIDDEEDEDGWEGKGGTIRASNIRITPSTPARSSDRQETPSPAASRHSRAFSDSSEFPADHDFADDPLDQQLVEATRQAELRHRAEMKGWLIAAGSSSIRAQAIGEDEIDRTYLFEIRALATRNYQDPS